MDSHLFHLEPIQLILDLLCQGRSEAVTRRRLASAVVFRCVESVIDCTLGRPIETLPRHRASHSSCRPARLTSQAEHWCRRVERHVRVQDGTILVVNLVVASLERVKAGRKGIHDLARPVSINVPLISHMSERAGLGWLAGNIGRIRACPVPRCVGSRQVGYAVVRRYA